MKEKYQQRSIDIVAENKNLQLMTPEKRLLWAFKEFTAQQAVVLVSGKDDLAICMAAAVYGQETIGVHVQYQLNNVPEDFINQISQYYGVKILILKPGDEDLNKVLQAHSAWNLEDDPGMTDEERKAVKLDPLSRFYAENENIILSITTARGRPVEDVFRKDGRVHKLNLTAGLNETEEQALLGAYAHHINEEYRDVAALEDDKKVFCGITDVEEKRLNSRNTHS